MKRETKETLAVISACTMLLFGIALTAIGFALDPAGEIHDSVLWVLGQSLIYAGAVFGIAAYTKGLVDKRVGEWRDEVRRQRQTEETDKEEEYDNA